MTPDLIPGAANKSKRIRKGLGENMRHVYKMKPCLRCGQLYLPTSSKHKWCPACHIAAVQEQKIINQEHWNHVHPEGTLTSDNKRRYGLTPEQYHQFLVAQGGKCAICGKDNIRNGKSIRMCVDHDHKTGKVRGLLCNRCNVEVGYIEFFQNTPKKLTKLMDYLNPGTSSP